MITEEFDIHKGRNGGFIHTVKTNEVTRDGVPYFRTTYAENKFDSIEDYLEVHYLFGENISRYFGYVWDPRTPDLVTFPSTAELNGRIAKLNKTIIAQGHAPIGIKYYSNGAAEFNNETFLRRWADEGAFVRSNVDESFALASHDANAHLFIDLPDSIRDFTQSITRTVLQAGEEIDKLSKISGLSKEEGEFLLALKETLYHRMSIALDNSLVSVDAAIVRNNLDPKGFLHEGLIPKRFLTMTLGESGPGRSRAVTYLGNRARVSEPEKLPSPRGVLESLIESIFDGRYARIPHNAESGEFNRTVAVFVKNNPGSKLLEKVKKIPSLVSGDSISELPFFDFYRSRRQGSYDIEKDIYENMVDEVKERKKRNLRECNSEQLVRWQQTCGRASAYLLKSR